MQRQPAAAVTGDASPCAGTPPRVRDRRESETGAAAQQAQRDRESLTHVRLLRSRCAAFFSATVASFWPSLLAITSRKNAHRTSVAAHTAAPARTTRAVSLSRCQRLEMRSGAHRRRGPWPGCARRRRCPPTRAPPRTRRSRAPCASSSPCSAASCARKPRPITDARHGATLPAWELTTAPAVCGSRTSRPALPPTPRPTPRAASRAPAPRSAPRPRPPR